jgi:hypothetical protein
MVQMPDSITFDLHFDGANQCKPTQKTRYLSSGAIDGK